MIDFRKSLGDIGLFAFFAVVLVIGAVWIAGTIGVRPALRGRSAATLTAALLSKSTPVPPTDTPACLAGVLCEVFPQIGDGAEFLWAFPNGLPTVTAEVVADCVHSEPYGLRLKYNYTGDIQGGWGVSWAEAPLGHFDASRFTKLTFWVKGTDGGERFTIGLKDTSAIEGKVESAKWVIVGTSWKLVEVPLGVFTEKGQTVNKGSIENVNFAITSEHGAGEICIDDIAFR